MNHRHFKRTVLSICSQQLLNISLLMVVAELASNTKADVRLAVWLTLTVQQWFW